MDTHKCPICNAPDIGNYTSKHIVCRVCNTDLGVYMQLNQFKSVVQKTSLLKRILSIVCVLGVIILLTLCVFGLHRELSYRQTISEANDTIHLLKETLKKQPQTIITQDVQSDGFKYTVRKGDSFWLISKKIYGTGTFASKIAVDNNMRVEDSIHAGDVLIIKN